MKSVVETVREIVEDYDAMAVLLKEWEREQEQRKRAALVEELIKQVVIVRPKEIE